MFTGLVSDIGTITRVDPQGDTRVTIDCNYAMDGVPIGASIACSGACLTVVAKHATGFAVDVSAETIARTKAGLWTVGASLNLERSLRVGDELGGHIVTGHVDGIGTVAAIEAVDGSHRLTVAIPPALSAQVAAKGSICLDGVSLTVNDVTDSDGETRIALNIIPHTWGVTTLGALRLGDALNVEIDILARYLARMMATRG